MFVAYALGLLPLADIGISPSQLPRLHIPNFITGELSKDEYESMERYLAEGVCGLISDRPALAADAVSAYERRQPKDFPPLAERMAVVRRRRTGFPG